MLGKIEDRRRGHQKLRWLDSITDGMDMNLGKLKESNIRFSGNYLVSTINRFRKGSEHGYDHLSMIRPVSMFRCQRLVKVFGFNTLRLSVGEP